MRGVDLINKKALWAQTFPEGFCSPDTFAQDFFLVSFVTALPLYPGA